MKYLGDLIIEPIKFRTTSGNLAYGYEATILADICMEAGIADHVWGIEEVLSLLK